LKIGEYLTKYQGFEVVQLFEAFQHHQVTDKPDYWHFEKNPKQQSSLTRS